MQQAAQQANPLDTSTGAQSLLLVQSLNPDWHSMLASRATLMSMHRALVEGAENPAPEKLFQRANILGCGLRMLVLGHQAAQRSGCGCSEAGGRPCSSPSQHAGIQMSAIIDSPGGQHACRTASVL